MNNIIISFDFELGWGAVESGRWREREQAGVYESLRPVFRRLITEMDAMGIPATWATVGAMVSDPCMEDFSHLPISAQQNIERFLKNASPMTKDGRDLFEILLAAKVPHEIASHSFSHTRFNYPGYDLASQTDDLKRSISVLEKWTGKKITSFVFPQNIAPDFEAVKNAGFEAARISPGKGPLVKRNFIQKIWGYYPHMPAAATKSTLGPALILHPSSLFFPGGGGRMPVMRRWSTRLQTMRALRRPANGRGDTHFWLHPYNLTMVPNLTSHLIVLLRRIAILRNKKKIVINTLAQHSFGEE